MDCSQASSALGLPRCNALYGEYTRNNVAGELQAYANLHLERSYQYLLTSAYFNNYQTNRAGFGKLFRKLSDEAWGKTIELIKHVTMRDQYLLTSAYFNNYQTNRAGFGKLFRKLSDEAWQKTIELIKHVTMRDIGLSYLRLIYANLHLERSYQYLLTSAYFNNYQTNRAGFGKLFRKLSDESWQKTIELIKHVTMRDSRHFWKTCKFFHLERSYQYLLTSAYFNTYQTNRAGFGKLFRKLSDEAWGKTIELIKHVTMRGDVMDFARRSPHDAADRNYTVETNELESLAKALDTQKEIAERAFHIHKEATKNSEKLHDPEITHYLEEEFIEGHAKTIRNLAGHTTDLKKFITANNGQDLSLALYLFDEYLQKVA
ncbi:ferritin-like domain-containing protein [Phthorimaea operculella]|nr:ferritin-like domain-containing protein [Phthorimaea operculella]